MPSAPSGYLVTRHDDGFGKVYPLLKGTRYSIGRAPTNKIVLGDDLCSREHAEIYFADGHWVLRDLGSLNGSRINNEQVRGEEQISSSDDVQLGRSRFLYVDDLAELPGIPDSGHGGEKLEIRKRLRTTRYGNSHVETATALKTESDATVRESRRSEKALGALYQLGLDMGIAETLEELVDVVLEGLLEGVSAEVGAVLAVKEGRDTELLAHRHRDPKVQTYHKVSQFVGSEVLSSREAILAENILEDPALRARESLSELKVGSLICAPVIFDTHVLGLVHLYSTALQPPLTSEDLEFTLLISRQFGIAWNQLKRRGALSRREQSARRYIEAGIRTDRRQPGFESHRIADTSRGAHPRPRC